MNILIVVHILYFLLLVTIRIYLNILLHIPGCVCSNHLWSFIFSVICDHSYFQLFKHLCIYLERALLQPKSFLILNWKYKIAYYDHLGVRHCCLLCSHKLPLFVAPKQELMIFFLWCPTILYYCFKAFIIKSIEVLRI